jgi:hypothetical protein
LVSKGPCPSGALLVLRGFVLSVIFIALNYPVSTNSFMVKKLKYFMQVTA